MGAPYHVIINRAFDCALTLRRRDKVAPVISHVQVLLAFGQEVQLELELKFKF